MANDKFEDILIEMLGPIAEEPETSNIPAGTQQGLHISTAPLDLWGERAKNQPSTSLPAQPVTPIASSAEAESFLSEVTGSKKQQDERRDMLQSLEQTRQDIKAPALKPTTINPTLAGTSPLNEMLRSALDMRQYVKEHTDEGVVREDNAREAAFRKAFENRTSKREFLSAEDMEPYKVVRSLDSGVPFVEYQIGGDTIPEEVAHQYMASYNDELLHEKRFKEDDEYRNDWFLSHTGVSEQQYRENLADELEKKLLALKEKVKPTAAQSTHGGYAALGAAINEQRSVGSSGLYLSRKKIDDALAKVNTLRKNNFWAGLREGADIADVLTLGLSGVGENVQLLNALNKETRGESLTKNEQALVDAWTIDQEAEEAIEALGGRSIGANIGSGTAQSLPFITQMIATGGVASATAKGVSRLAAKAALKKSLATSTKQKIAEGLRYGSLKVAESAIGAAARVPFSGATYKNYGDKRINQFQLMERMDEATGEVQRYVGKKESSALNDAVHAALESFFEFQSEDVGGLFDYGVKSFAKSLPRHNMLRRLAVESIFGPVKHAIPQWIKRNAKIYSVAGEVLSEAYGDAMVNLLTGNEEGWKRMATSDYWWELTGVSAMLSGGFSAMNRGVNRLVGIPQARGKFEKARLRSLDGIRDESLRKHLIQASMVDDLSERSKMLAAIDWEGGYTREDMARAVDFITAQTSLDVMDYSAAEADRLNRLMPALANIDQLAHDKDLGTEDLAKILGDVYAKAFRTQENQQELNRIADRVRVAADAGISARDINNILADAGLTVYEPGDEVETLSGVRGMVNDVLPGAYELLDANGKTNVYSFEEVLQPNKEVAEAQMANAGQEVAAEEQAEMARPDAVQQAVDTAMEVARAEAEKVKNLDDNIVYEATMTDGSPVHIVKGSNIVYNEENGDVDYDASEATVVVQFEDGQRKQVSIRDIDSIDEVIAVDEMANLAGETALTAVETAQAQAGATETQAAVEKQPIIGRSLSDEEANAVIARMENNATVAPELELTPENWDAQFGEDGIVATPIGDVKMGENQYLKMSRQGRDGKLGMVKPTLENPDLIVEEKSSAGNGAATERNSSFVFLKAFTNADGSRMYKFASVTIRKDVREVVISNQEKETPRIKRLLKEGMLTYISDATLPSESTASTQGVQPTIPGGATLSDNKNTTSEPKNQEVEQKNVQKPAIPTLKNGQPDYNAMTPEQFVEQYVANFGEENAERIARNNIKEADKQIADLEKKMNAVTDPNKLPDLVQKQNEAKARKERYSTILNLLGVSEDANVTWQERAAATKKAETHRIVKLFPDGLPNVEGFILADIATGNKIRWSDKVVNGAVVSRGLGAELGLADSKAERSRRIGTIAKDAPTPEEYAEQLRERLDVVGIRYDESELRDKVLDVYGSVDTVGGAWKALETLAENMNQQEEGLDYEEEMQRRAYGRERQETQPANEGYKLSSEVDENGRQFVLSSSGNVVFGEISEESSLTPAPILLSEGMITNKATNDGYGLVHIEARHGDQIRKAGYKSVVDFIENVAKNYEVIKEGNVRDGNNTYLLQITDKHNNTLMVELSGDGTYWNINTAGIFKTSYGKNRKEVYNRHTTAKQPAETDEASRNAEPSGTQANPSMITASTLTDNKNTTSEPKNQEVEQKNVDDHGLIGEEELSVEDEAPFMVTPEVIENEPTASQLATDAAVMALKDAGVEVVEATPEMVEEALQRRDIRMQAVERKFEEQLLAFTPSNASGMIFNLGLPSPMLMAGGVANKPIRLYGGKLLKKMRKHGFAAAELKGLPTAIANPIAVFDNYRKPGNRSILTELKTADGNFLVSVDIGVGSDIDFDIVKTVFGKDGDGVLNWINKGYLTIVDKEKALAYLRISAPIAEASNKQELDSATKIVENFENPKIVPKTSFSVENPSLVGLHNISEEKLRKALRMGGLVNPSVAVVDSNTQQHAGYGDITFVLPSSLVAQETGKNIGTYFGDAWTPTYPQVERRMRNGLASKDIASMPDQMQNTVRLALNSWLDGRSGDALAYMFLYERGEAPELQTVKAKYSQELRDAMLALTGGREFYYLAPEQRHQVLDLYIQEEYNGSREKFDAHLKRAISRSEKFIAERGANSLIGKKAQEVIDTINEYGYDYDVVSGFVRDILRDAETSGVVDAPYTALLAERKIKEDGLEQEYAKWIDSLTNRYAVEEVIFKGFTPSGNRKYVPNTLENASKEMREQGRAGATGFTVGFSRFAAKLLKPEGTLDAIRKRKGQLKTSYEEVEAFKDKWSAVLFDLAEKCQPDASGYEDYGFERLAEAATKKSPKDYLKKEYGVELSNEDAKRLNDMIKAIRTEYPVMYFETKFERPVYFNEFAGVVVPSDVSEDVVQALKDAGLSVVTYTANDEAARMKAVKEVADTSNKVMFNIGHAPAFISNAKIAVMGIKQEKATPEQWLKMIEKAGGLKAGEDKWIGFSDWLKASGKKSLTKQEVLDFINENQIQIEEKSYASDSAIETTPEFATLQEEYRSILRRYTEGTQRNLEEFEERMAKKYDFPSDMFDTTALNEDEERAHISLSRAIDESSDVAFREMVDSYGDDFEIAFDLGLGELRVDNAEAAASLLGLPVDAPIYHLREDYTTKGLIGNREIALTVPAIEPWNEHDETHFGDAGEGRAIAWVRFGETTDSDGKRVLVIDEVQSKRHQEGRERGYGFRGNVTKAREDADDAYRKVVSFENEMAEKYGDQYWTGDATNEEVARWEMLCAELDRLGLIYEDLAEKQRKSIPKAPFEKNWAELAMKRMLRYAAENSYDKVAWTKGNQQAERYDLSKSVDYIEAQRNEDGTYDVDVATADDSHFVEERGVPESRLSEFVGKEIALSIVKETQENKDGKTTIEGDNLRIGGEGMRAFYDQMLPSFMRKYCKKWGATVQDVTLPNVEEAGRTMHSVDVTNAMRESVMQGQPMFYRRPNGIVYGWTNGKTVYLTPEGMNPNTPIHEYTHIWADAMMKNNPKGWESIVKLLKGTPVWNEVLADVNYANIKDNDSQVASEALSRLSGRNNAAEMEAMAQQVLDEADNDSVKKNRARKLLDRMRKALQEFWSWVGKELFGIEKFNSIDEVTDRVLYDLVSGTDLGAVPAEGVRMDQQARERAEIEFKEQLSVDKSFIHAYDSAFDELSSEYDALDKNNEAALKAFRAKKLDLVERYMSSMSSNLAMPTAPVVVDASNIDSVKKAYELLPNEYRKFVTFDAFIDGVSSSVGFYVADSKMSVYNISKDDTLNSSREWLGALAHENGHKVVETLGVSDSDKAKLWEFCKRTTTSVRKKIEKDYESATERGEEYLVYTIQTRARYPRLGDLLAECIIGEKTAQDIVKTFKDSLPLRDEIVEKILNYFRDGYRKTRGEADYSTAAGRAKSKEEVQGFYNRFRGEYSQGLRRDNSVGRDLDEILFSIGEQPLAPVPEKVEPTEEEKRAAESEKRLKSLTRLQKSVRGLVKKLHETKENNSDIARLIAEALESEVDKEGLQKFLDTSRFISEITSSLSKESIRSALDHMSDQIANAVIKHRKELLVKTMGIQVQSTTALGIAVAHGVDDKARAMIEVFRRFHKLSKLDPAYETSGLTVGSKVLVSTKNAEAFSSFLDNDTSVNELDKQDLMIWHNIWSEVADAEDAYITISLDIDRLGNESRDLYRRIKATPDGSKVETELKQKRKIVLEDRRNKRRERLEVKQQIARGLGDMLTIMAQRIDVGRNARKGQMEADREYRADYLRRAMQDVRVGDIVKAYDDGKTEEQLGRKKSSQRKWGFYKEHYYSFVYMVQSISVNATAGKGFLYDSLIEGEDGVIACENREISMNNTDELRILAKAKELGFKNLDELAQYYDRPLMVGGEQYMLAFQNIYEAGDGGEKKRPGRVMTEHVPMTIGYAVYLAQMADQPGIAPTLTSGMKISKDDITALKQHLENGEGKRGLEFMQFAVGLLRDLREERYNDASLERFGTQLDNNENYFPVRRLKKNLRKEQVDLDQIQSGVASEVQASVTASALVKRVRSYTAIDVRQNPLRLLVDHVHEMNHFTATVPVVRNLQILLNSQAFKEQLNAQKNILGQDKMNNYDRFELSAALAVGSFKPKTDTLNEVIADLQSMVAAGKVSLRFFTAAKQILSLPAFAAYSTSLRYQARLLRNILMLGFLPKKAGENRSVHVVKWCMENIPTYRARWTERHAGDERIQRLNATAWAKWMYRTNFVTRWIQKKVVESAAMLANASIDIFACGIGARSVYEYELANLMRQGVPQEEARATAKRRAAIAFNESQQSSLNAFLSPAQKLRDLQSLYLTMFENSNRSYGRKASLAYDYLRTEIMDKELREKRYKLEYSRELERLEAQMRADLRVRNENEPNFERRLSDEKIEGAIKAKRPEFEAKAAKVAADKIRLARKRATLEWFIYKVGLNYLWKTAPLFATSLLMNQGVDDEDRESLNDYSAAKLLSYFAASYFRNGVGGATIESIIDGFGFDSMLSQNLDNIMPNVQKFVKGLYEEEGAEVDWQAFRLALNSVSNMAVNVDLNTLYNIYVGIKGTIDDRSLNDEDVLRIINAPKSMIEAATIPIEEGESEHDYIRRLAYLNEISSKELQRLESAYKDELTNRDRSKKRKMSMWAKNYRAMENAKILGTTYEKSRRGYIAVPFIEDLDEAYNKVLIATHRAQSGSVRSDAKERKPLADEVKARISSMGLPRQIRRIWKLEKKLDDMVITAPEYAETLREVIRLKKSLVEDWNNRQ